MLIDSTATLQNTTRIGDLTHIDTAVMEWHLGEIDSTYLFEHIEDHMSWLYLLKASKQENHDMIIEHHVHKHRGKGGRFYCAM